jgi:hypothetical protein
MHARPAGRAQQPRRHLRGDPVGGRAGVTQQGVQLQEVELQAAAGRAQGGDVGQQRPGRLLRQVVNQPFHREQRRPAAMKQPCVCSLPSSRQHRQAGQAQ